MKHANIAVFIPHAGCTHQCSFCNQRAISGTPTAPSPEEVRALIGNALQNESLPPGQTEIAFFGGSFTALHPAYMGGLLSAAAPYIQSGQASGIRISTRPDCITGPILKTLKTAGVTAIELGAQCMSNRVLVQNSRGHTAEDIIAASGAIQANGFSLGLQMMTGLYAATPEDDRHTAAAFIGLNPDTVRIYPTVVVRGTRLDNLYQSGNYIPQTLEQSVALTAELLEMFYAKDIGVIRVGLHRDEGLVADMTAGPYHPAYRELCEGAIYLQRLRALATNHPPGELEVAVSPGHASRAAGHRAINKQALAKTGHRLKIHEKQGIPPFQIQLIDKENG